MASQLEVLSLGIITKKGPDFFELFAPLENDVLQKSDEVSFERVEERWNAISGKDGNVITKEDANLFISKVQTTDRIQQVINLMEGIFPLSNNLRNLAIILVCVGVFHALTLFGHRFATKLLAIRVSRDLRQKYFEHIQSLPMEFYQKYNIGSLSSRVVGDASLVAEAVTSCLVNYLQTPFTIVSTLLLCFMTSWQLSLIVFLGFPAIVLPIVYIANKVRRISRQIQVNQERFSSVLIDFISGIQTVKVFNMEDFSLKKYQEQNQQMASLEQKIAKYDLSSRPVVHTIAMSFLSISMLWGLYVLRMSVSEAFFFCGLLYIFYEPVKKFAEENSRIQRGIAAADRVFEVLDIQPQIVDQTGALELKDFKRNIEFDNVSFRYGDEWILKNLSFTVEKGQTVAIVGPTGSGKSTIVQLIPRLYDVQQGEIRIDGIPIRNSTQRSLREMIAFVPQRPFLFLDTIAANIAFGRPFSFEEIVEAAKKAHADEFISRLSEGYHTPLSETGKNLSGGQQQRLAIARALVKKAPILIMDEATSSLDTVSENYIKSAIKELRGQMTQIIIAHRLSTIEDADKIIYLEDGCKLAEGTKEELLSKCYGFHKMWEAMHHTKSAIPVELN
jgi:ABC-type multidrug transport system fused ATPase/permease subunit